MKQSVFVALILLFFESFALGAVQRVLESGYEMHSLLPKSHYKKIVQRSIIDYQPLTKVISFRPSLPAIKFQPGFRAIFALSD